MSQPNKKGPLSIIAHSILYYSSINLLIIELHQLYNLGRDRYFRNGWNKIDLFASVILFVGVILKAVFDIFKDSLSYKEQQRLLIFTRYFDLFFYKFFYKFFFIFISEYLLVLQ